MKLKRILAFLLTLALVLGALPLAVFATYTAPTAEEIEAALESSGEENAGLVYANDIEGVSVTPTTTGTENNTTSAISFTSDITKGTYFSYAKIFDQGTVHGRTNVYATADKNGILWKSHPANMNDTTDNNNCLDIGFKDNQPLGKNFVLEFEYTMYQEAFEGEHVIFRVINRNRTFDSYNFVVIENKTGNLVPHVNGKAASDIILADPAVGETVNVAVHVKTLAPVKEGGHGSVVFDVYINGELKASNLTMYSEATLASKKLYAQKYAPEYFRLANTAGELVPYGLSCSEEDHTACGAECPYGKDLYSLDSVKIYYSDVCYSTVHGTNPHTLSYSRTDETNHIGVCSECGYQELGAHKLSQEGYCSVCEAGIMGVSLSIDSDLAIRYYVNATDTFTEGKALTMKVGGTVIDTYTVNEGKYVFTYDGIGPHQVGDTVNATLYAGDVAIDSKEYSAEQYCREALELCAGNAKLVQLVNDLLIYAKAADTYKNGSTDIAADLTLTASDYTPAKADDKLSITGNENGAVYAAGVRFDSLNKVYFKLSAESAPAVTLNGVAAEAVLEDGYYVVYSEAIAPVDYNKTFTLALGDTTVTYTVNTYAYYMQGDAAMRELASALYRYGKSCEAYVSALRKDIIYNLDGGTNPSQAPAQYDREKGTTLPIPSKYGYLFDGWYTEADFSGEKVTEITAGTEGAFSVYAKWKKIEKLIYHETFTDSTQELTSKPFSVNSLNIAASTSSGIVEDEYGDRYLQLNCTTNAIAADTSSYDFKKTTERKFSIQFDLLDDNVSSLGYVGLRFFLNDDHNKRTLFKCNYKSVKTSSGQARITYRLVIDLDNATLSAYSEDGTVVTKTITKGDDSSGEYPANPSGMLADPNLTTMDFIIQASSKKTVGVDNIIVAEGNIFE